MSERLEAIKQNMSGLELLVMSKVLDVKVLDDFNWLIEQAEKVEKFEFWIDKSKHCLENAKK